MGDERTGAGDARERTAAPDSAPRRKGRPTRRRGRGCVEAHPPDVHGAAAERRRIARRGELAMSGTDRVSHEGVKWASGPAAKHDAQCTLGAMASFTIDCSCGERYHVDDSQLGRELECRRCGNRLQVVRGGEASTAQPTSPTKGANSEEVAPPEEHQADTISTTAHNPAEHSAGGSRRSSPGATSVRRSSSRRSSGGWVIGRDRDRAALHGALGLPAAVCSCSSRWWRGFVRDSSFPWRRARWSCLDR